jgi:hypothetical protein
MKYSKIDPAKALSLKPGIELDVFIWEYVMDAITTVAQSPGGLSPVMVPSFSRKPEASKMLTIMLFAANPDMSLEMRWGMEYCDEARKAGHIVTDKIVPVWRLVASLPESQSMTSYGRTMEEAVSKMCIIDRLRRP